MSEQADPSNAVPSAPAERGNGGGNIRLIAVALVIVAALGFLVFRGLGNATLYFRTADEAVAQRQHLGDRRFRLEGNVVPGTIQQNGTFTDFEVVSKGTTVQVHNQGQPLGVFRENISVVVEGRFATGSNVFDSDRILVRHSADYEAKHPDRLAPEANK